MKKRDVLITFAAVGVWLAVMWDPFISRSRRGFPGRAAATL
jgi:hypothetical protein